MGTKQKADLHNGELQAAVGFLVLLGEPSMGWRKRRNSRGFTLMEVLVTTVLVSLAVVGIMGGISSVERAQVKAQTAEMLQRLASDKLGDLSVQANPSAQGTSGDFSDRGYPNVTWTITDDTTSTTNLDQVTVTATQGAESQAVTTLVFIPPTTSSTSTSTGGATGGAGG